MEIMKWLGDGPRTPTNEAAFDTAAPGLAIQTFAAATITPTGSANTMANSLNSSTNNGIFATGDILPGLSISGTGDPFGMDLAVTDAGFFTGVFDKAVISNFLPGSLNLNFDPGVEAVGLGLISEFRSSDFLVSFFDPNDSLLGSTLVLDVPNHDRSGMFFGVIATGDDQIGRINLFSTFNPSQAEGVVLVEFGDVPETVPEPATLALLGIALAGLGFSRRRKLH